MRTYQDIATDIKACWRNINPYAEVYRKALATIDSCDARASYGLDEAGELAMRFLANASGWRGEDAKRIKAELKAMIGM